MLVAFTLHTTIIGKVNSYFLVQIENKQVTVCLTENRIDVVQFPKKIKLKVAFDVSIKFISIELKLEEKM